jgi:hypothetical protein
MDAGYGIVYRRIRSIQHGGVVHAQSRDVATQVLG